MELKQKRRHSVLAPIMHSVCSHVSLQRSELPDFCLRTGLYNNIERHSLGKGSKLAGSGQPVSIQSDKQKFLFSKGWVFSKRSISGEYSATKGKQNDEIGIQSYIMSMAPFAIKYIEFFYRQFGTLALMHAIFVHECH